MYFYKCKVTFVKNICITYLNSNFSNGHTIILNCSIFMIVFSKYTHLNIYQIISSIIQKI